MAALESPVVRLNMGEPIFAIDPGPEKSAAIKLQPGDDEPKVEAVGIIRNEVMLEELGIARTSYVLAIEQIEHYGKGMPAGKSIFDTCQWTGRFLQRWEDTDHNPHALMVPRRDVKIMLCNSSQAKDPNVRQALIDLFGGEQRAIGGGKCTVCNGKGWKGRGRPPCDECCATGYEDPPGPLYRLATHLWAALGVGVVAARALQEARKSVGPGSG